jgi:hypothetical protein
MNIFNDNLFNRDFHYNLHEGSFFQDAVQYVHQMHQLMNNIFQLEHEDESNATNKSYAKAESVEKEQDESESYHYSSKTTSYSDGNGLTNRKKSI